MKQPRQPYTLLGEPSPKLLEIYLKEYHEKHYKTILAHLRKLERLRNKWVAAHNEMMAYTHALDKDCLANPYAARRWLEFYCSGGVTADDWKSYYKQQPKDRVVEDDPSIPIRNLRCVARTEEELNADY